MNARRWGCSFLFLLFLPLALSAQPLQVWLQQYGTASEIGYHMIQTSDGNYAHCVREGNSGDVLYLRDADGLEILHHTYGESGNYDAIQDVVELPGGGFLLAGYEWVDAQGAYDARLIRTDASGIQIWSSLAGDAEETDYGRGLVRTADGRIFMAGQMWTGTRSEGAVWEFNEDGDLVNTSLFSDGEFSVGFYNIDLTSDNHLVMSGGGYFEVNNQDGYAVECDLDGNQIWEKVVSLPYWQYMTNIRESADGYFIFAGNAAQNESGFPVYPWYGRLDADGHEVFSTYYDGSTGSSYLLSCTPDIDGNWLLAGRYEGAEPHQDALLVKIDPSNGDAIWSLFEGNDTEASDEGFSEVLVLPDGTYIASGDGDFGALTHPGFIAMYNETGSGVAPQYLSSQPREFSLVGVYPNPFNAYAVVQLDLAYPADLTVDVVNVNGQVVSTLQHGWTSSGTYHLSWRADQVSSGVYFVRATVPGQTVQLRKVTLIR